MGKEANDSGKTGFAAILGGVAYLCLSLAMLSVVWQDFAGDRVFLLPGRGDSHDVFLYWRDNPYLCLLVVMAWLAIALLLLAGLAMRLVAALRRRP